MRYSKEKIIADLIYYYEVDIDKLKEEVKEYKDERNA